MVHSAEAETPSFPELLRFKRVQAGLTQRTLADLSTISPRTIRALESGRVNARMQTVRLLADALGLDGLARELFVTAGLGGGGPVPVGAEPCPAVPRSVNALLGRDVEVRSMVSALESDHRRMISLSGLAGVGKSRVAAETAARLSSRRGWPVLWIGSGTTAPAGPGTAFGPLLRSLRLLVESGAQDVSAVCRLIGRHELLLVLDGVADARDPVGVEELLAYCPGVRVVSTSRAPWTVAGVQGTVLAPLAVPGPDGERTGAGSLDVLTAVPSVRLLVDRLAEVRPGFVLGRADAVAAVRLCRTLDGLPAALEAAAAGCGVLSLRRLADMPAAELLELPAAGRPVGVPGTIGCPIRSGVERLDPVPRKLLGELAGFETALTACEAAETLRLPMNQVVGGLGALTGGGFVRAAHGEAETRLHLPNLVRAALG
ncbi:helix-turn-helix domain-containing protein [Streptomyces sp. NPDC002886]|uniref:helix-turn-helix domain-containing protein n=1 Tax=Streptomyces sp. NPDC002886 TaxID=3364667 RepID=UPI0036C93649